MSQPGRHGVWAIWAICAHADATRYHPPKSAYVQIDHRRSPEETPISSLGSPSLQPARLDLFHMGDDSSRCCTGRALLPILRQDERGTTGATSSPSWRDIFAADPQALDEESPPTLGVSFLRASRHTTTIEYTLAVVRSEGSSKGGTSLGKHATLTLGQDLRKLGLGAVVWDCVSGPLYRTYLQIAHSTNIFLDTSVWIHKYPPSHVPCVCRTHSWLDLDGRVVSHDFMIYVVVSTW